jgi:hypothetical protein
VFGAPRVIGGREVEFADEGACHLGRQRSEGACHLGRQRSRDSGAETAVERRLPHDRLRDALVPRRRPLDGSKKLPAIAVARSWSPVAGRSGTRQPTPQDGPVGANMSVKPTP